jgi:hypothetical protein
MGPSRAEDTRRPIRDTATVFHGVHRLRQRFLEDAEREVVTANFAAVATAGTSARFCRSIVSRSRLEVDSAITGVIPDSRISRILCAASRGAFFSSHRLVNERERCRFDDAVRSPVIRQFVASQVGAVNVGSDESSRLIIGVEFVFPWRQGSVSGTLAVQGDLPPQVLSPTGQGTLHPVS